MNYLAYLKFDDSSIDLVNLRTAADFYAVESISMKSVERNFLVSNRTVKYEALFSRNHFWISWTVSNLQSRNIIGPIYSILLLPPVASLFVLMNSSRKENHVI